MFKGIAAKIRMRIAALEDQRIEQLRTELQKNVDFALARLEKSKQDGARRPWTQLNVPNSTFEYQSPDFPFVQWSPMFKLRVEQALDPILKKFFDGMENQSLHYRMSQTWFMKGRFKSALSRFLPRNRYGDSPFVRYYITINAVMKTA